MKTLHTLLLVCAVALTGTATAHDAAMLDTMKAPNGGQLRAAGAHHYELVVAAPGTKGDSLPVTVYVTDHAGTPVPTQGAVGSVTLLSGGKKTTVTLQATGKNALKGQGSYVPDAKLKAIVSVTLAGQPPAQAKFEPMASAHHH